MNTLALALIRKYGLAVGLLFALLIGYLGWAHYEREIGARDALNVQLAASLVQERERVDSIGRAAVAKVDTFTRWRTRWDTNYVRDTALVASLNAALDSMRRAGSREPDTVRIAVPVRVLIVADSTIHACTDALNTCGARFAAESTLAMGWKAKALAAPSGEPSALAEVVKIGLGALGGYALGRAH